MIRFPKPSHTALVSQLFTNTLPSQHIQKLRKARETPALSEGGDDSAASKPTTPRKATTPRKRRTPAKKGAKTVENGGGDDDDDSGNIKLESYRSDTEMASPAKKVKREQTVGYVYIFPWKLEEG